MRESIGGKIKIINRYKIETGANLTGADLTSAYLANVDLTGADLTSANLRNANLRNADLTGADLDFSVWPLWCGSADVIVDERLSKQKLAHAFNGSEHHFPGGLTDEQRNWLNDFHRIKYKQFPKFRKEE